MKDVKLVIIKSFMKINVRSLLKIDLFKMFRLLLFFIISFLYYSANAQIPDLSIPFDRAQSFNSACYSLNGEKILLCSDSSFQIWNSRTSKWLASCEFEHENIETYILNPLGDKVLTLNGSDTIKVWPLYSSWKDFELFLKNSNVPDKDIILRVLGRTTDEFERMKGVENISDTYLDLRYLSLVGHSGKVNSAKFNNNGNQILTSSEDSLAILWDSSSGDEIIRYEGHKGSVISAEFSHSEDTILTCSKDNVVRLFSSKSGKILIEITANDAEFTSAKFSPNGQQILTTTSKGELCIWNTKNGNLIQQIQLSFKQNFEVQYSPNGKSILVFKKSANAILFSSEENGFFIELFQIPDVKSAIFSPNGAGIVILNEQGFIKSINSQDGNQLVQFNRESNEFNFILVDPSGDFIFSFGLDGRTIIWDAWKGESLGIRLQLKKDDFDVPEDNFSEDWLIFDKYFHFDGSPGGVNELYLTCGPEIIDLKQVKDALYVPELLRKIMNGEDINYQKLSDLDICGALPLIEKVNEDKGMWEFKIEERKWPIVRLDVKVDGKTVSTIPTNSLKWDNRIASLKLFRHDLEKHFKPGEENNITVIAITEFEKREFQSRGVVLEILDDRKKSDPKMYMLMIGVNDYKDDVLDLKFPVSDARAFGAALESSAKKLLGDDKVFVYNVQSKIENNEVYTTPEKAGVMKALEEIGKKAKSNDVLFIFFAGHGVMQGADNSFTFLTADASKLNPVGISTTDLKSWLSPEGPFHMMPNKTVLVYDACNSGQASKELADLAMARDDNATERQRQIEDLGDKSGVFILSASAPNQSAYELPHLGQGMLTYSLLTTLKNNPGVLDESENGNGFLNLQKWFLETEREQSRLMQSLGLNQDAQPYGTANIRIGIVDDEVREGITLMAEKPLVYCTSARDDSEEDPLELKQAVNAFLETATSRGTANKLGFIKSETSQANILKLVYSKNGDTIECRILIFKNKLKINEININTSTSKAAEDVVKAVEGVIK